MAETYVLDTDTCVYWLNGDASIDGRIVAMGPERVRTTFVTECELYYGAYKSGHAQRNIEVIGRLRRTLRVLHSTPGVAAHFGRLKATLERRGELLDDADLLIAATVLQAGGILVTNNTKHFNRVPGLALENWRESTRA